MTAKEQKLGYDSGSVSTLDKVKRFASRNGALIGLIILCIILSIATPAFLTGPNLLNVGIQAATVAILAFGQTFVIVEAGIDLSVGSVAAVSSMLVAYTGASMGLPPILTIVVGLVTGAVFGALSGIANAFLKLPSFIATLAMMSVARGLTLVISDGRPVSTSGMVNFLRQHGTWYPDPNCHDDHHGRHRLRDSELHQYWSFHVCGWRQYGSLSALRYLGA